jgi:small-conductance mechanosensitive channel
MRAPSQRLPPQVGASVLLWAKACLFAALLAVAHSALAVEPENPGVALVIGNRTIHVFRDAFGAITAEERAELARAHVLKALESDGEGWTSFVPTEKGVVVTLDGAAMFTVVAGDARKQVDETPEVLANQASRILQKVWSDSRERRDPQANVTALLKSGSALAILLLVLALLVKTSRLADRLIAGRLAGRLESIARTGVVLHFAEMILTFAATAKMVLVWLLGLLATFAFISYALGQFVVTRPFSEAIFHSLTDTLYAALRSSAHALPGIFVAIAIFLFARIATRISRAFFDNIAAGRLQFGALDAQSAPSTRYLVNAALWLFALAMAYPYLPGSQTEAFKGLSVLLGVMVSIGAAGPVGQIASGMILAFTKALLVGEYVRIQEFEGTVTHLGLYVTRLRTGNGEEIALPNSLLISQVTRNYSRNVERGGFVVDTSVTIGYDTPWRQVHAMLLEAATQITVLRRDPAPFVVQTELSDFYVGYRLVAQVGADVAALRPQVLSDLNGAIQDVFNKYGVQIMSPHYLGDPDKVKLVPESRWYEKPATPFPESER